MSRFPIPSISKSELFSRINYLFVLLFVLLLPFNNRYITYVILPWICISITLAYIKKIGLKEIVESTILFIVYYTVSLISLLYSVNVIYGIKSLETMVSLIIMPFLLLTVKRTLLPGKFVNIINMYLTGLILYILASVIILFIRWDIRSISSYLETNSLTSAASYFSLSFLQHRSYISMYLIYGIVLIINRLFNDRERGFLMIGSGVAITFAVYIIILGSRAALITLLLISIYYFWKSLNRYSFKVSLPLTLAVLIIFVTVIFRFTRIGETVIIRSENSNSDVRISLWANAFQVFKHSPVFGYGIGDGHDKIALQYERNGLEVALKNKFNAHNQFLETSVQTGIIGVTSLILIFLIPLIKSIRKKREMLFLFIVIIIVNLLFESMFVRLSGVLFIAFWLNFLILIPDNSESEIYVKQ